MRIVVTGLIAQYPLAGVTWDYVQYPMGLLALGHEVTYLEDSRCWPYDPATDAVTRDPEPNVRYLAAVMARIGLAHDWCYRIDLEGGGERYYGLSEAELRARLAACDVFLNVSGACFVEDRHLAARLRVYIDSDPVFTQLLVATGEPGKAAPWTMRANLDAHQVHFSFGERLGAPDCPVPTGPYRWRPTRQPIVLDAWPVAPPPPAGAPWTTVMNWSSYGTVEYAGRRYGQKDVSFERILDLPRRCPEERFEPAIAGGWQTRRPDARLAAHGWRLADARAVSSDTGRYQAFIAASKGEVSIAKAGYVEGRSGWFSCRSACYLASGRPCVLEDTGFSEVLPTGVGLLPFSDLEGAVEGVRAVARDWPRHARAARRLAEAEFDARLVLARLLAEATA